MPASISIIERPMKNRRLPSQSILISWNNRNIEQFLDTERFNATVLAAQQPHEDRARYINSREQIHHQAQDERDRKSANHRRAAREKVKEHGRHNSRDVRVDNRDEGVRKSLLDRGRYR